MTCIARFAFVALAFCMIPFTLSPATANDGPLSTAVVSFGQWEADLKPQPLDRVLNADPTGGPGNTDAIIPSIVTIKQGGAVNFIISGGHIVTIYGNGKQPSDVGTSTEPTVPAGCNAASAGGILSDSDRRIYRGACNTGRRDGVEVVEFGEPGTYLVICSRANHFFDHDMYSYVRVLPGK